MPGFLTLTKDAANLSVSEDPQTQIEDTHWYGNQRIKCSGEGCQRCQGGNKARRRYIFSVYSSGQLFLLALPEVAYEELQKTLGRPPTLARRGFAASRVGQGGNTRYRFVAADGGAGVERVSASAGDQVKGAAPSPAPSEVAASLHRAAAIVERLPLSRSAMLAAMVRNVADMIRSDHERERSSSA